MITGRQHWKQEWNPKNTGPFLITIIQKVHSVDWIN